MMKKFNFLLSLLIMASTFVFTACSDDDKTVEIVFPESVSMSKKIGETGEISFNAGTNWRLTSSSTWLVLVDEGFEVDELYGQAGTHTVTFLVKGDGADFGVSNRASIAIMMNGITQNLCQVTREPLAYEVTVTDAEGKAITDENPFQLLSYANASIKINANYVFRVSAPSWVEVTSTSIGEANTEFTFTAKPAEGFIKNENSGVLSITNSTFDAQATFEFPVVYAGLPEDEIIFSENPWQWEFTADGSQYYKINIDGDATYYPAPMALGVTARNDAYTVLCIEEDSKWGATILNEYTAWFNANDDKRGNLSVTVNENESAVRKGMVMVLPNAIYNSFGWDVDGNIFDFTGDFASVKEEMEKYIALDFTQNASTGKTPFTVSEFGQPFELFSFADQVGESTVIDMFGTTEVYIMNVENRAYDQISIEFNDVNVFQPVYPDTFFNGENTIWDGIEFENAWTSDYKSTIHIYGIQAGSSNGTQMIIQLFNGSTDSVIGYLIVEQW